LIFYPLSLGLGPFDPFDVGYRPKPVLLALVPIGIALIIRRKHALLLIGGIDLLAYALGLFENLWSALFDPVLVLVCGADLIKMAGRRVIRRYLVVADGEATANQPRSE
jgi:hypothetical protein